jgi:tetratricopeptide (TPR) repeat protein
LLIRDAAYEALPKSVRADLHERFALWLEERGADLVELDEIVGYHLEQAARYRQELGQTDSELAERAGERLAAAGQRALWRGDYRAAEVLLKRALALLRPLRLDVELELNLISTQPRSTDWVTMTEDLADRARVAGDRPGEAVARVEAAHHRTTTGTWSVEELETLAQEAIPLLEAAEDHAGLARVWYALGQGVASPEGQHERWAQAVEQAILHRRQIGQPGLLGLPYPLILGPRPADEALQTLDSVIADETDRVSWAFRAVLLAMLGRFEEAWDIAREADRRERELTGAEHSQRGVMQIGISLEEIAALEGDHEAAARHMQEVCALLENEGWTAYLSTYAPKLGRSLCYLGRYDEAEPLAQQGRELGDEHDVVTQMLWRQVQGLVLASRGDYAEAEQLVRDAIAIADRTDALNHQGDARCDLAEVLERAGRAADAKATLAQALERYERKRNLAMVAQIRQRMTAMPAAR